MTRRIRDHSRQVNLVSNPLPGKKAITNIWWDPDTQQIVVEHD